MRIKKDVVYSGENKLDCYLPDDNGFSIVVFFHGGGLESGHKAHGNCLGLAEACVREGVGFISADYRKYPTARFPQFIEDGAHAVKWAVDNAKRLGGNGKVFLLGQSAGAYISLMLLMDDRYLLSVGIDDSFIDGFFIDSAQTTTHFNVLRERGEDTRLQRVDEGAPMYFVGKKSLKSKVILTFYTEDMPCRYEQNMLFYKGIKEFDKNARIEYHVLNGRHCQGSAEKVNGIYPIEKYLFEMVKGN